MPFRIALSGLNAAQSDLNVTANNIANTSTNGFKGSRAEFADLFAVSLQGVSSNASGNGVRVAAVAQQFAQGNIEFTDSNLDLAISGPGHVHPLRRRRARVHARRRFPDEPRRLRGQLRAAAPAGVSAARLAVASTPAVSATCACRPPTRRRRPPANVEYVLNLPANATPPPIAPFDPNDPNTFNQATSLTLFDSLGATHTGTMYFDKTANRQRVEHAPVHRRPPSTSAAAHDHAAVLEHRPADRAGRRPAAVPGVHADHRRGRHDRHRGPGAVDAVRRATSR